MSRPVTTIIKYPGGKAQHMGRLMRYQPTFEPRVIVDAFCGSCAFGVEASRIYPKARLVLNDTNAELVNALLQIRDHAGELAEMLRLTPYSRDLFHDLRSAPGEARSDIEAARDWLVRNRQSVGGCLDHTGTGWSRDQQGKKITQWERLPDQLKEFAAALVKRSYIESQDFEALLLGGKGQHFGWDAPDAWIYLDPPYPGREHYYGCDGADGDLHARVARVANACTGAVMLSYADTPEFERYAGLYPEDRWRRIEFQAVQHMRVRAAGEVKGKRTELLLLNYEPAAEPRQRGTMMTVGTGLPPRDEGFDDYDDDARNLPADRDVSSETERAVTMAVCGAVSDDDTMDGRLDTIAQAHGVSLEYVQGIWRGVCDEDAADDEADRIDREIEAAVRAAMDEGRGMAEGAAEIAERLGVETSYVETTWCDVIEGGPEESADAEPLADVSSAMAADNTARPGELELWNAEAQRAIAGALQILDAMIETRGPAAEGTTITLPAKITLTVDGEKIAVKSEVGRLAVQQVVGEKLQLAILPRTPAALRKALFERHTSEQLSLLDQGLTESQVAEIEAGRAAAEAEGEDIDGEALADAFGAGADGQEPTEDQEAA